MKPVPLKPIFGTTSTGFPLHHGDARFQIMPIFPGYRNLFSRGCSAALSSDCLPRVRRDWEKPHAATKPNDLLPLALSKKGRLQAYEAFWNRFAVSFAVNRILEVCYPALLPKETTPACGLFGGPPGIRTLNQW